MRHWFSAILVGGLLVMGSRAFAATKPFGQEIHVFDVNKYGVQDIIPFIIIDECSATGEYDVFSVNALGIRKISPDAIITSDEFTGKWKIYRVNDFGLRGLVPTMIAEETVVSGRMNVYDISRFGLKDIWPSAIIERAPYTGDIKIFGVSRFGLKDIMPSGIITEIGGQFGVYSVNRFGVRCPSPTRVAKVRAQTTVFGILLLPSIPRIVFDPTHPKIRTIQDMRHVSDSSRAASGWLRSKPR